MRDSIRTAGERRKPEPCRLGQRGFLLALFIAAPVLTTACGSGAAVATTAKPTEAAITATCERVADILSDGPDPDVDPVGYTLAQVLPLRQVKAPDATLKDDIANLASAYESLYKTSNSKVAKTAVADAGKKLDTICPGAF